MQGLKCHFISLSGKSLTKLVVTSRHDHSCLLGRKTSNQTNEDIIVKEIGFLYQKDNQPVATCDDAQDNLP